MIPDQKSESVATDGGTELVTEIGAEESTTQATMRSIAAIKGVAETDLDPLYDNIDPDALETMIQHADEHDSRVEISFAIDGYRIYVRDNKRIQIIDSSPA